MDLKAKAMMELKAIYNFHPDEEFNSFSEILEAGRKSMPSTYRDLFASHAAETLARWMDRINAEKHIDS